jgi:PKD repeat protein
VLFKFQNNISISVSCRRRISAISIFCFFIISISLSAQTEMPNPPSNIQLIPAGSYIIAMDTANQKLVAPFNLKAYGLVNQFLQNQFPVKWAIRAGKSLNAIDFSALVQRAFPTTAPAAVLDFRAGPFIVPDTSICGITTQNIIQNFGNNVCVYRLSNNELIDVRYTITHAPKIAIFTNGGNQNIHSKILTAAGITNFDYLDAAHITSLNSCYSMVSEPHWDADDEDSLVIKGVKNFVMRGGNFLAQCEAVDSYENLGFFATTTGINILNKTMVHAYHNPDMPILQINGLVMENEGGSLKNFIPKPGSTWKSTTYKVISHNGSDSVVCMGMHIGDTVSAGGNAFLLGSHDYYNLSNLKSINALRLYLNVVFIPSINNNVWARAGMDQAMTCAGAASLGCAPTGPPGATYTWSPSSGLNCSTCSNPLAIPSSSTNYTVTVRNLDGCTAKDNVLITTNLVYPVAGFNSSAGSGSVCANVPVNFINQSTNGAVQWSWDFGDSSTSTQQNPSHAYANSGTYAVTLTAINAMGCTNSTQHTVTINPLPQVDFTFTPACIGHVTCFLNGTTVSSGTITNWSWNFGDTASSSNTSNQQDPCHAFINLNSNITLIAFTNKGCSDTLIKPISFSPDPVASFTSTVNCENTPTCFSDLSTVSSGSIVAWNWNFNDPAAVTGDSSTIQNPCYTYSDYINKIAILTVTSDQGCQHSDTGYISFNPTPVPSFSSTIVCKGNTTSFTNLSSIPSGSITNYQWDFGETASGAANISFQQNPCHAYSNASSFNVSLIATSDLGCRDSVTLTADVAPLPVVNFSPSWGCLGSQTSFSNLSSISTGSINGYQWMFTDITTDLFDTSSLQNPIYIFSTSDPYSVSLIAISDIGCRDTNTTTVLIYPNPVADFNSTVVCPGITTCFTDQSSISSGSIVDWQWNFSDPASLLLDSSSIKNPCHTFINNSSSQATLTVTSNIGCQSTITKTVSFNPVPVADFSSSQTCIGSQTTFTDLSNISSGSIINQSWNFGEPSSGLFNNSLSQNPVHTYSTSSTYNVKLITTSINGCQDSITHAITISPIPSGSFSSTPVCFGNQTCFDENSTIATGTITSYNWNFNDPASGSANSSILQNPCHLFSSLSSYNVSLILVSDAGCSDTVISTMAVNPNPVATYNSTIVCPGNQTCFTDHSTISSGTITNWSWNFSDTASGSADSSHAQSPCHTFLNNSSPNVSLTVTSNKGCQNTFTTAVTFNAVPSPDFNYTNACLGTQSCFNDLTTINSGSIVSRQWTFGDPSSGNANSSSLQNPCHDYLTSGSFEVVLMATSNKGCQQNVTKSIPVSPLPVANFSTGNTCQGSMTCFTDLSSIASGNILSHQWDFGDLNSGPGNNSSLQNPCHLFSSLNNYNVSLILLSDKGCSDTLTTNIEVAPIPVANFSSLKVCPGNATCFSDLSAISTGVISDWNWTFTQGSAIVDSSTVSSPCFTYSDTSSAFASLKVISDNGCQNTFTLPVSFNPVPVPIISATTSCVGKPICINNQSTISQGTIANYSWDFDDIASGTSNNSAIQNPCHSFTTAKNYNVKLEISSDKGCIKDTSLSLSVYSAPAANYTTNSVCVNSFSEFLDQSTSSSNDHINVWEWDFGDGSNASGANAPNHFYNSAGTFTVTLDITTASGCRDSVSKLVTVHAQPVANIASPQQGCAPLCETFTDLSTATEGNITSWNWSFPGGNLTSSTQRNPVICYSLPGTYPVSLIVQNTFGCSDTLTSGKESKVFAAPEADFYVISEPEDLLMPELTLGHNWSNDVVKWYWNFGDDSGIDSMNLDPKHVYTKAVFNNNYYKFKVALDVKNQFGCIARLDREFNIKPVFSFFIPNTFSPNDNPPNDAFYGKGRGISEYKITIYDRWGMLIWQCESNGDFKEWDKENGEGLPSACKWDGNLKGRPVQQDVYVWMVELKNLNGDSFNYVGHVTVIK